MKAYTISIVTTSFNHGEFISATIHSVLTQSGEFFIDYIIMDGGSTDQTISIIRQFEETLMQNCTITTTSTGLPIYVNNQPHFPYNQCKGISFRWFSATDHGQVDALKNGFKLAFGDIYCWLNSDDVYLDKNVLSKVVNHFITPPFPKIVTGDGLLIDRHGKQTGIWHVDKIDFKELLFLDYHILQPSTFFRKEVYQKEYLNEKYICAFDADFFIHLIKDGIQIKKIEDRLSAYRIYPEIKTIALSKTRFLESVSISWSYSRNIFYSLISIIYKAWFILYKPKFYRKNVVVDGILAIVYKLSYFLITGNSNRIK